jgi:hypothetical protein
VKMLETLRRDVFFPLSRQASVYCDLRLLIWFAGWKAEKFGMWHDLLAEWRSWSPNSPELYGMRLGGFVVLSTIPRPSFEDVGEWAKQPTS